MPGLYWSPHHIRAGGNYQGKEEKEDPESDFFYSFMNHSEDIYVISMQMFYMI